MSNDFSVGRAARTFYGEPQHETGPRADPERLGVTAPSPQSERTLYDYARTAGPGRASVDAGAV